MKLTQSSIKKFVYEGDGKSRDVRWDSELKGFGIRIYPSGQKSFVLSYRNEAGKKRLSVLGAYGVLTLDEGRKKAKKTLAGVLDGDDPLAKAPESDTIDVAVAAFLAIHKNDVRAVSHKQMEGIMNGRVLPAWKGRRVPDIGQDDLAKLINGIRASGKAHMALQTYKAVTQFFRWAKANAYIDTLPFDDDTGKKLVPSRLYRKRDRILSAAEIRRMWNATDEVGYPIGPIARFILVTGQRPGTNSEAPLGEVAKACRCSTLR